MQRQEFLSKLGISLAAVCIGCNLSSCGSDVKNEEPTPNQPTNPGATLATIDLNSDLKNVGESTVANKIIIVRLAAGNSPASFTAVSVACTHQGTSINYNPAQGKFICPNHGSQFSTTGSVLLGPAALPLQEFKVAVTGSSLTVTA
jgi:cytochrome b6-f complex iron-sulfur subunit